MALNINEVLDNQILKRLILTKISVVIFEMTKINDEICHLTKILPW